MIAERICGPAIMVIASGRIAVSISGREAYPTTGGRKVCAPIASVAAEGCRAVACLLVLVVRSLRPNPADDHVGEPGEDQDDQDPATWSDARGGDHALPLPIGRALVPRARAEPANTRSAHLEKIRHEGFSLLSTRSSPVLSPQKRL